MRQRVQAPSNGGDTGFATHQRFPSVRRLLKMSRANGRLPGAPTAQERNWRNVPKINLLPAKRATAPATSHLRLVLLVILLVEAFFIQQWYREVASSQQQIDETKASVESAELQLADERKATATLRTQLSQLQAQRTLREEEFNAVTGGRIDWHVVLAVLFNAETAGSRFLSVTTTPEGEVTVQGVATAPEALRTLPSQLSGVQNVLNLQSIKWQPGSNPPTFTAVFRVRR